MEAIVTLTPEVSDDPLAALGRAPDGASVVEVRTDLFPDLDIAAAVASCPLPVLVTNRSESEGGAGPVDPAARSGFLERARDAGAALVDVEYARDLDTARRLGLPPEQTVLSWHDVGGTPGDLAIRASAMLATGSRHVKVVPTAHRLGDIEPLLELYAVANREKHRLIAMAMGTVGMVTRILGPLLGSPIAFTAWRDDTPAAPGQFSIDRVEAIAGHLQAPPQRLFGIVGRDVRRSLSPELHAAAYRALDLPYLFVPLSVPEAEDLELLFQPAGYTLFDRVGLPAAGWAVTTPYKDRASAAARLRAPRVERCGAANTLILRSDSLAADTTDADGVVGSLRAANIDVEGRPAVVQGTGGAGRAAAVGLDLAGASVAIRGRTDAHTEAVATAMTVAALGSTDSTPDGAILVNATPLGANPDDECPFSAEEVARAAAVVDMVYADHPTSLERAAADAEIRCMDGRAMLAYQGFAQFAAFTGRLPPKDAMLAAVRR